MTSEFEKYNGYKWIKVPSYKLDESKSWEDRYYSLYTHHVEETTFLIEKIKELAAKIDHLQP